MATNQKALLDALRERMISLAAEANGLKATVGKKREELRQAREVQNALAAEFRDLERIFKRYANGAQSDAPAAPEPAVPDEEVIGATQAILTALRGQYDGAMRYDRLIEHLASLRERGLIRTKSESASQKLFGSVIGNMIRHPKPKIGMQGDGMVRLTEGSAE